MAPPPQTWTRALAERVGTLWVRKMLVTTLGIAVFFYAYFWVMHHPLSALTVMPVTWIDELIAFRPYSFFLYGSLWIYVALGSALLKDGRELAAWGAASVAMTVVGLGTFMAFPTQVPDFPIDWSQYPSLGFLKTVDISGNACPSLHAAFAVFTAVVIHAQLRAIRAPRAWLAGNVLWCLSIVHSTMATRQHVALDIVAGAVLAGAASIAYLAACRLGSGTDAVGPAASHSSH